jgi:trypsin
MMSLSRTVLSVLALSLAACSGVANLDEGAGPADLTSEGAFIVGGKDTDIHLVPWQVALLESGSQVCGGTIISAEWIVTAAHCETKVGDTVGAGQSSLAALDAEGQTRTVAEVIVFPGYTDVGAGKDIALLRLDSPLQLDDKAMAIPYATEADATSFAPGVTATVSGWGLLETNGQSSDMLQRFVPGRQWRPLGGAAAGITPLGRCGELRWGEMRGS